MKTCVDCNQVKSYPEFTRAPRGKDGYEIRCKVCRSIKYNKSSVDKVVKRIYSTQLINSAKRGHQPPTYTEKELLDWVSNHPEWETLYSNWKQAKYSKETKPSVDRNDLHKPYTMDNIQLVTWKVNQQNQADDSFSGHQTATLRPVKAYTKDGQLYKEYYSIAEAIRELNGQYWGISTVANGVPVKDGKGAYYTPRTYKGFIWKWA